MFLNTFRLGDDHSTWVCFRLSSCFDDLFKSGPYVSASWAPSPVVCEDKLDELCQTLRVFYSDSRASVEDLLSCIHSSSIWGMTEYDSLQGQLEQLVKEHYNELPKHAFMVCLRQLACSIPLGLINRNIPIAYDHISAISSVCFIFRTKDINQDQYEILRSNFLNKEGTSSMSSKFFCSQFEVVVYALAAI